jgi:hypothetical protein
MFTMTESDGLTIVSERTDSQARRASRNAPANRATNSRQS